MLKNGNEENTFLNDIFILMKNVRPEIKALRNCN